MPEATSESRRLVVVSAGLGQPSSTRLLADRLAAGTARALEGHEIATQTTALELRDHAQDLAKHLLAGFPGPSLREAIDAVLAADGLIAVTPVFNGSFSGLFKLFFDVIERDALEGTPMLIGATGGTARHSLVLEHAMRPLFVYLGAAVGVTGVFAAPEDWGEGDASIATGLVGRVERAAGELATAMAARRRPPRVDPYADPVPFEDLLAGR